MSALKLGSKGDAVKELQTALAENGYLLLKQVDGDFGKKTDAAVRDFQTMKGLVVDGIVGGKTLAKLAEVPKVKTGITNIELAAAAQYLGVEYAAVAAISEVESAGGGFNDNGTIKVLFERHWFYRQLVKYGMTKLAEELSVSRPDLCNKTAGGYTKGKENARLEEAMAIHRAAALDSASYGRFQIMGFNHEILGFTNSEMMYNWMCKSEANHLEGFCRFIRADKRLHEALRELNWAEVARIYNGPNYAINQYDVKLDRAYKKHSNHKY